MHLIFINSNEYNPISDSECLHFTIYENFTFLFTCAFIYSKQNFSAFTMLSHYIKKRRKIAIFSKYCQYSVYSTGRL